MRIIVNYDSKKSNKNEKKDSKSNGHPQDHVPNDPQDDFTFPTKNPIFLEFFPTEQNNYEDDVSSQAHFNFLTVTQLRNIRRKNQRLRNQQAIIDNSRVTEAV